MWEDAIFMPYPALLYIIEECVVGSVSCILCLRIVYVPKRDKINLPSGYVYQLLRIIPHSDKWLVFFFCLFLGGFSQMYACVCDWLGSPYREEVQWVSIEIRLGKLTTSY